MQPNQYVRAFAGATLAGLTLSLAVFNVMGWLSSGLIILAILALFFEALGFVFAVLVEDAVKAGRFDRAFVALVILLGCAAFNTVGGHRAWDASMADRQAADQGAAQAALDARRGELLSTAARAQAEVDRVPMPRPDAYTGRQEAARETWEVLTAGARDRKAQAEATLATLPVVAEVAPPFDERVTWGFLAFLELAKAAGLWAIGMSARPAVQARQRGPQRDSAPSGHWDASEAARRLVSLRRDRQTA